MEPNGIIMDGSLLAVDGRTVIPDVTWGQWFGDIAAVVPESEPEDLYLQWTGAQIPPALFREILGFFKWSFDKYRCEAQLRLYYRPQDKQWKAVVMPQFIISGSSSKEDDKDDEFDQMKLDLSREGFGHVGSAHHHCTMPAFQSMTDYKDEIVTEGFHYTIGCLDEASASFHARCVVRKLCYTADIIGFVPYIDNGILALKNLPEPPQEWRDRMTKKPVVVVKSKKGNDPFGFASWKPGESRKPTSIGHIPGAVYTPTPATSYVPKDYDGHWCDDDAYDYYGDDLELGADLVGDLMESAMTLWGLKKESCDQFEDVVQQLDWSLTLADIDPSVFQALADYTASYHEALEELSRESNNEGIIEV